MIIDRALWLRVRPLFDELADLDPDEQRARLELVGQDDPLLRDSLERLLVADSDAERALRDYSIDGGPDWREGVDPDRVAAGVVPDGQPPTGGDSSVGGASAQDPLAILGRTIAHFHVTGFVAAGGMGVVYRAEDLQLGRTVALKFPLPNQIRKSAAHARFVNEARSAGALDHPNLCAVHEVGESGQGLFLAMPFYPGETLRDRLSREGRLGPDEALGIVVQAARGLACAHAAGIVHRDLKPANVMLLPDGTVRVLDFGLAKIRDTEMTQSRATLGTIGYIAPEQVRGGTVDARTDLWAIGVMLYETVTGNKPFPGEFEGTVLHAVLNDTPVRPSTVRRELPTTFDDVIGMLLEKDPSDRYPSAEQLLVDLEALQRGDRLLARPRSVSRFVRRLRDRRVSVARLAAAVVLVGLAAAAWRASGTTGGQESSGDHAAVRWTGDTAHVTTSSELAAVLIPANAGRHVRIRAGTYDLVQPLAVPDGMSLEGAGVMTFGSDGLPAGFTEGTRTLLRLTENVGGDVLTLGDATTLRNLEIQDLAGRSGNLVAVVSRHPNDSVSATLSRVVIVNPNPSTIAASGALGRGLYVATRNQNLGADPTPDNGSVVAVRMETSIIRSPGGGGGFFAFNFAANARVSLELSRNIIGGSSEANGGVSRPDAVHDSEVRITSDANLYRNEWRDPCTVADLGWNITGGSGAPLPLTLPETVRNTVVVRSSHDRIEGFTTGVLATGSRQFFETSLNALPADNHVELRLVGTTISTPACSDVVGTQDAGSVRLSRSRTVADLRLVGASVGEDFLSPGNGNTILVELRDVTGSGLRANHYADASGTGIELPRALRGEGNRLWILGDQATFARENRGIEPVPDARYFIPRAPGPASAISQAGAAIPPD